MKQGVTEAICFPGVLGLDVLTGFCGWAPG